MTIPKAVALTRTAASVFSRCPRARLLRWGATDEEVGGPYPGAAVVPDVDRAATTAVTIDAPPEQVWPWLVQMGWDRGGCTPRTASTTRGGAASTCGSRDPRPTWKAYGASSSPRCPVGALDSSSAATGRCDAAGSHDLR